MILSLLLTELTRRGVRLSAEQGRLKIKAPPGALTEDLRRTVAAQKAALLRFAAFPYVETVNGLGTLTGKTRELDVSLVAEERKEALRYRIGVVSLDDGIERFCYPQLVLLARLETMQVDEPSREVPS